MSPLLDFDDVHLLDSASIVDADLTSVQTNTAPVNYNTYAAEDYFAQIYSRD